MKLTRKHIRSLNDEEIVLLYQKSKDKKCIGELYSRYSPLVMGVCLKYLKNIPDAQDNLMQVFEKLMEALITNQVRNFKPWLYQVSKNQCLMHIRKAGKIKNSPIDNLHIESQEEKTIEVEEKEDLLNRLEVYIPKLKDNQRVCIELFYLQNKSYQEIADETNFSLKEVKSNIQNGKRNLQLKLTSSNS